jgi:hypothetical protein
MSGFCRHCGECNSYIGYGRRKYCSNACRQASYRKRKAESVLGVTSGRVKRNISAKMLRSDRDVTL